MPAGWVDLVGDLVHGGLIGGEKYVGGRTGRKLDRQRARRPEVEADGVARVFLVKRRQLVHGIGQTGGGKNRDFAGASGAAECQEDENQQKATLFHTRRKAYLPGNKMRSWISPMNPETRSPAT